MRRLHLFELEDQRWFPRPIRDAGTDFIRFMAEMGDAYRPIIPRLRQAVVTSGSRGIVDLCSGGGGPIVGVCRKLAESGCPVAITLTDKHPNRSAFRYVRECSGNSVDFIEAPVDATAVPVHLAGFRTLFASLHHFRPEAARRVLQDAVAQRQPIAAFEMTERSLLGALGSLLLPLGVLLATPFIRPFRWSRLLWTYLVPIVPFFIMWDGFVSGLRTYSTGELRELVDGLQASDYTWEMGRERGRTTPSITYLMGYTKETLPEQSAAG